MNDSIFKSMGAENTLNAGPQEIVTDESIGIKGRRSAKSLIIGAIVVLGAGAFGYASYIQSQRAEIPPGLESPTNTTPGAPQPITTAEPAQAVVPTPIATDTTTSVATSPVPAPVIDAAATPQATPEKNQVNPAPAVNDPAATKEVQVKPEVTNDALEKQLEALLPNEKATPFVQPEKKKVVAKKPTKQAAAKNKESNPEPVASEELVTSEQILIYSE